MDPTDFELNVNTKEFILSVSHQKEDLIDRLVDACVFLYSKFAGHQSFLWGR